MLHGRLELLNHLRRLSKARVFSPQHGGQQCFHPFGNLVRARPIEALDQQIANNRRGLREDPQQLHHLFGCLLTLSDETRSRLDRQIVFANRQVVYPRRTRYLLLLRIAQRLALGRAVLPEGADNPFARIDMRDQVEHHPPTMADRTGQIILEMKRGHVALALACIDGLAARFIRRRPEGRVVQPHDALHVVVGVHGLLQRTRRDTSKFLTLRRHVAPIGQKSMCFRVGRLPLARVIARECLFGADEWCLGSERDKLGRRRAPEIEHALRIRGIADQ